MRFLADAGISPRTVDYLRRNGHDAIHVREIGMQRAADRVLVEKAQADERHRQMIGYCLPSTSILARSLRSESLRARVS